MPSPSIGIDINAMHNNMHIDTIDIDMNTVSIVRYNMHMCARAYCTFGGNRPISHGVLDPPYFLLRRSIPYAAASFMLRSNKKWHHSG